MYIPSFILCVVWPVASWPQMKNRMKKEEEKEKMKNNKRFEHMYLK